MHEGKGASTGTRIREYDSKVRARGRWHEEEEDTREKTRERLLASRRRLI